MGVNEIRGGEISPEMRNVHVYLIISPGFLVCGHFLVNLGRQAVAGYFLILPHSSVAVAFVFETATLFCLYFISEQDILNACFGIRVGAVIF